MNRRVQPDAIPVLTLVVKRDLALAFLTYGIVLLVLAVAIVGAVTGYGMEKMEGDIIASVTSGRVLWQWAAVYLATMVLHEMIHGMFMRLFGGRPKFGAGIFARIMPYFYAISPGYAFSFTEMMVIGLAPLVVISFVTLVGIHIAPPILVPFLAVAFVGNFSGAVGDLWFARFLWRFRHCSDLQLVDKATDRMALYTPDPLGAEIASGLSSDSSRIVRFLLVWFVTMLDTFLIYPFMSTYVFRLLFYSNVKELVIGPDAFPLLSYVSTSDFVAFKLALAPIVVVGLLLPLIDLLWRLRVGSTKTAKPKQSTTRTGAYRPAFL